VRREILSIAADPRSPERGQYSFVQALIREVAYNTLARADRKTRHLAAARFFESLENDEIVGALAGQYVAAHENAPEGPEAEALAAQARIALKAAAERATSLGSLAQAMTFLDQARAITTERADLADLLERAGKAAALAGLVAPAEERLRQAVEVRRELGDQDAIAGAVALLGDARMKAFRRDEALTTLVAASEELVEPGIPVESPGRVALLGQLSRAYFLNDGYERAIAVADRALEAAERLDLVAVVADVLITRGGALCHLGRSYEGRGAIRAGIELAEERGLVSTELRGRLNLGVVAPDHKAGFDAASGAHELARRYGLGGILYVVVGNLASAAVELGEWERGIEVATRLRDDAPDELSANYAAWALMTYDIFRGEVAGAEVERLREWARSFDDTVSQGALHELAAELSFAAGSYQTASDEWLLQAPFDQLNAPGSYVYAGIASLIAGDAVRVRKVLDGMAQLPGRSRMRDADRRLLEAGLDALEGHRAEAFRDMRFVLGEYEALELAWRHALGGTVLAATIGPDEPDVRALAQTAREIFARLGAKPFLDRLDALLRPVPAGRGDEHADAERGAVPLVSSQG